MNEKKYEHVIGSVDEEKSSVNVTEYDASNSRLLHSVTLACMYRYIKLLP